MSYYDERLKELQAQVAMKRRLETVIKDLRKQFEELSARVEELEKVKSTEQADVDRLEGRSLANFFYNVVGKMDDKLTKERQEAYEAAVKYDAACRELQTVKENLRRQEIEFGKVRRSEEEYQKALSEKQEAVKLSGNSEAADILNLEERIAYLKSQETELNEAISAGKNADWLADRILSSLSSAEGWGTWDLLGGGIIADAVKHGHLDDAQAQVEQLQVALRSFKTELADVDISADMQVNIEGFLRFADYFFDGLFADWTVLDRISESQNQVQKTKGQIKSVLARLTTMLSSVKAEKNRTEAQLKEVVIKATI